MGLVVLLVLTSIVCSLALYIPVPGGYAWDECVHNVPSDSHIYENQFQQTIIEFPNGTTKVLSPCAYARKLSSSKPSKGVDAEGWQSWVSFSTPDNSTFTKFLGNFSVPSEPENFNEEGILYMFTGVQNYNWVPTPSDPTPTPPGFDIIQPVLQYGRTPDKGGKYWAVASWYVTLDDNYIASKLVKVNAGDIIYGTMTNKGGGSWFIGAAVVGTTSSSNIQVSKPRLISQPWAYCTLEVYNIDKCEYMPSASSVQFTNLYLETSSGPITPTWQTFTGPKK
eukprot:Phypoly_transcript_14213.p1 GENE.Phypoly_transcript_14213~~Phypoly_transcript_14213.p1  ORF type:complete len:302 (-),score=13.80 Phypoly_transcript_14213:103-942(-)